MVWESTCVGIIVRESTYVRLCAHEMLATSLIMGLSTYLYVHADDQAYI